MNGMEPNFLLNLGQLIMLGGLIWGLARMSKSVDTLKEVTDGLTVALRLIGKEMSEMSGRILVLEDRTGRRATDVRR